MKRNTFTEGQIIKALKEYESGSGKEVAAKCRELGIHKGTFYNWRKKYGSMEVNELKRLKDLEDENRRLKQMYVDLALDHKIPKAVLEKNVLGPAELVERVDYIVEEHKVSISRACKVVELHRSVYYRSGGPLQEQRRRRSHY